VDIKLSREDRLRVDGNYFGYQQFIDIDRSDNGECLGVTLFAGFSYVEVRKKGDLIKVFSFPKKSLKRDFDFGHFEDAEIVYSCNEQIMNKD
jgi:hypothetical protein